jgi:hypothetical protein
MRQKILVLGVVFGSLISGEALALEQPKHRDITQGACQSAGIATPFCKRLGAEAYNVDYKEWNDLSAHAQPADGQSLCNGANSAAQRATSLGSEIRSALGMPASQERVEALAVALGRVLHTLQDNCAHQGVSNPQHAWWSLMDSCEGTRNSPDVQSDAIACARTETEAVMAEFRNQLNGWGVSNEELGSTRGAYTHWPSRAEACEFLDGSKNWNGQDVRWDSGTVVPALRDQFLQALWGSPRNFDFCSLPDSELSRPNPEEQVDTSGGPGWCLKLDLFCAGKADAPDQAPPWSDGDTETEPGMDSESDAASTDAGQGCSLPTSLPRGNASSIFALAGLLLALRRRADRKRASLRLGANGY